MVRIYSSKFSLIDQDQSTRTKGLNQRADTAFVLFYFEQGLIIFFNTIPISYFAYFIKFITYWQLNWKPRLLSFQVFHSASIKNLGFLYDVRSLRLTSLCPCQVYWERLLLNLYFSKGGCIRWFFDKYDFMK